MPDSAAMQKLVAAIVPDVKKLLKGRGEPVGGEFLTAILFLVQDYDDTQTLRDASGDIVQHRDRLRRIQDAARTLSLLMKNEPLDVWLLDDAIDLRPGPANDVLRAIHGGVFHEEACRRRDELLRFLLFVEKNSDRLLSNPGELEIWRIEDAAVNRNAKPWRSYIWEPLFRIMTKFQVAVPITTRGPMIRLLNAIHDALGLEQPDPEALKKAAEAYHRGKVASRN